MITDKLTNDAQRPTSSVADDRPASTPPSPPPRSPSPSPGFPASSRPAARPRVGLVTWVILLAIGVGLGALVWRKGFRDHYVPRNFGVVEDGQVYRAGRLTPSALSDVHKKHNFKTVIDLGAYDPGSAADAAMQRTAEALGVTRYRFSLEGDGTGNPNYYVAALRLMSDENNRPVLVHCAAGSERTSACIIFYKTIFRDEHMLDIIDEPRNFRHDFNDNPRMIATVAQYRGAIEHALRTGGWVPGYPAVEVAPVHSSAASGDRPAARAQATTSSSDGR